MTRISLVLLAASCAALLLVSPASAEERWASATADPANSTCLAASPCSLQTAVEGALASSEIIVTPGTYVVPDDLKLIQPIAMHGQAGQPRPVIRNAADTKTHTFKALAAARLSHLEFQATTPAGTALKLMHGAQGERLVVRAASSVALDVDAATAPVTVANTLAVSAGLAAIAINGAPAAERLTLRNVTAIATGPDSAGLLCTVKGADAALIVNSVVRGAAHDVNAESDPTACAADHSNIRVADGRSPGLSVTANIELDPGLDGGHRPVAGSSLVDAGVDDALNGPLDLDGSARTQGAATDIGAFESTGGSGGATTDTGTDTTGSLPAPTPPKLGASMIVKAQDGVVYVHIPGTTKGFVVLEDMASLPPGAIIDATRGAVVLRSVLKGGKQQTATFRGGKFRVRQSPNGNGMVDVDLVGGNFKRCRSTASAAEVASASKRKRRYVRRLWVRDNGGKYRTHGRQSVATVRGTRWLTEDRCSGTFTKVTEGAVDVKDKRRGTVRRVRAGQSLLVRARRR